MAAKRTKKTSGVEAAPKRQGGAKNALANLREDRKRIDGEVGRAIAAYESRLEGVNPYRILEFAARCAERVWPLGIDLKSQMPEASGPIDLVTDLTALGARLAYDAVQDPGRVRKVEIVEEAKKADKIVSKAEIPIYTADRWSYAILELGRIAARLFELTEHLYKGKEILLRRAASVPAHAEQAMINGAEEHRATANRAAIEADLEAMTGKGAPKPFPSLWPVGSDPFVQTLSSDQETYYKSISVAAIRFRQSKEPPLGLESLTVPTISPGEDPSSKHPSVYKLANKIEEATRLRQQKQIKDLQRFLNLLAGKQFGSQEAHKGLADFITRLAARADANLTISGEFPDPTDKNNCRVFSVEPVTVRCDNPRTKSLMIRSTDKHRTHIVNTTFFPQFYAFPKT